MATGRHERGRQDHGGPDRHEDAGHADTDDDLTRSDGTMDADTDASGRPATSMQRDGPGARHAAPAPAVRDASGARHARPARGRHGPGSTAGSTAWPTAGSAPGSGDESAVEDDTLAPADTRRRTAKGCGLLLALALVAAVWFGSCAHDSPAPPAPAPAALPTPAPNTQPTPHVPSPGAPIVPSDSTTTSTTTRSTTKRSRTTTRSTTTTDADDISDG